MNLLSVKRSLILCVLVSIFGCNSQTAPNENNKPKKLPTAIIAQVLYEKITELDEYTGRLSAPERVELRARVSGYIEKVNFEEGAIVKQGDLLFSIDPASFNAELKRSQAQLSAAKSIEANARSEFNRAKRLIAKKAISQELLDERRAEHLSATAELHAAEANLSLAQLNVNYTKVTAPISGRVSNALSTKGNFITAGQSMLTTIVSTDKIYAYFNADERAYLKYSALARSGQRNSSRDGQNPVLMGLANDDDYPYQGVINFVDNSIDPLTSTIRGRAVFENTEGSLIPGLFARIRVPGSAARNVILIDEKAIGTDLDTKFVLILDDNNMVKRQAVIIGAQYQGLRIIKQGLEVGDHVVIRGLQRLRPGVQVTPEVKTMASEDVLQKIRDLQTLIQPQTESETLANKSNGSMSEGG